MKFRCCEQMRCVFLFANSHGEFSLKFRNRHPVAEMKLKMSCGHFSFRSGIWSRHVNRIYEIFKSLSKFFFRLISSLLFWRVQARIINYASFPSHFRKIFLCFCLGWAVSFAMHKVHTRSLLSLYVDCSSLTDMNIMKCLRLRLGGLKSVSESKKWSSKRTRWVGEKCSRANENVNLMRNQFLIVWQCNYEKLFFFTSSLFTTFLLLLVARRWVLQHILSIFLADFWPRATAEMSRKKRVKDN